MRRFSPVFTLSLSLVVTLSFLATSTQAARIYSTVVDDSFADGDRAKTGALDTNWWTSSSSSGDEISVGSLGLVTGTSGRGLHTIFPTQTLGINEGVRATYTFTTPDSINVGTSSSFTSAFRIGLFDDLGRAGLNADVSASSGSPNDLYGWGAGVGGTGTDTLPGYFLDMDVYNDPNLPGQSGASTSDLNFREHNHPDTVFGTGRLMATSGNFTSVSPSGPDEGYLWAPNTTYTGSFEIIRKANGTDVLLRGTLGGIAYQNSDDWAGSSFELDMLAFHVNSRRFGTSNSAGDPDNGIDFSNIKIEFSVPEPSTMLLMAGALVPLVSVRRRK